MQGHAESAPQRPHRERQRRTGLRLGAVCLMLAVSACSLLPPDRPNDSATFEVITGDTRPDPAAPRLPALDTRHYSHVPPHAEVIGEIQVLFARHENTLSELARSFGVGYNAITQANPSVDAWLPGDGTPVYLPTMHVIPTAPRDGVVVNLPSMRLLHFSNAKDDRSVASHAIGIGREGWATPLGATRVTQKAHLPAWYPPASVRAEHEALGDPLPTVVPPGPDNPLGDYTLKLAMPGYLIHGTNKPAGVGMRISHGCIRMYPEGIETLFARVPKGTPVHLVNEPVLAGWRDGVLYLEVHPPLAEDERLPELEATRVINAAIARIDAASVALDEAAIARVVREQRGIPFPVSAGHHGLDRYLAQARVVANPTAAVAQDIASSR